MGESVDVQAQHCDANAAGAERRPASIVALTTLEPANESKRETRKRRKAERKQQKAELSAQQKVNEQREMKASLAQDDLVERMRLRNSCLVDEVQAIALRFIDTEDKRESRLDSKAQGLLVTAGLSLTVAFTFGGIIVDHRVSLEQLARWKTIFVAAAYIFALLAGLTSSICATRALLVTDKYRNVDEDSVFSDEGLAKADTENVPLTYYRRYMTVQYWMIAQQHCAVHKRKAALIRWGQMFFIAFLLMLMLIGSGLGLFVVLP
jgi:hypothetical protein